MPEKVQLEALLTKSKADIVVGEKRSDFSNYYPTKQLHRCSSSTTLTSSKEKHTLQLSLSLLIAHSTKTILQSIPGTTVKRRLGLSPPSIYHPLPPSHTLPITTCFAYLLPPSPSHYTLYTIHHTPYTTTKIMEEIEPKSSKKGSKKTKKPSRRNLTFVVPCNLDQTQLRV